MINFYRYGTGWPQYGYVTLAELLIEQREDGMLQASAEHSGSESCYCEVARWNDDARQWQRYAFCKCDHRLPELPDASDEQTALAIAEKINSVIGWRPAIIHRMPDFSAASEPIEA